MQRGSAAEYRASVSAPGVTVDQLELQGLRYLDHVLCDVTDISYYIYIYGYIHMLFVFQGSPGLQGSQGHPGDEGTSVSVKCLTSSSLCHLSICFLLQELW